MTPHEIALIQDSFRKLSPMADQVAPLFYARLFELDPSLRQLFHGDMETQGRNLMQAIGSAVASLHEFAAAASSLQQLGARHTGYGVRDEHYATVGSALLWTLQKSLGAEFTPALKSAWTSTYALLARTMMPGARNRVAAA